MDFVRFKDLSVKVRSLDCAGKLYIRRDHIEKERIYREITTVQVQRALQTGEIVGIREKDSSVIWQGRDADGRCLELNCTFKNEEGEITLMVNEISAVIVGTAYDPSIADDEALKVRWLMKHSDYEDAGKRKGVQKKLSVIKI
jgi:hypothetical protein